jgi:amino acid adenylation domain-containing protein
MVEGEGKKVGEIGLLSEGEREEVLSFSRGPEVEYRGDRTVVELFEAQAREHPEAGMVVYEGRTYTYGEIKELSNRLSRYLSRRYGAGPGAVVGIRMERSPWQMTAIMGVLKTGAAYMPIDPDYPLDRIAYMIKDSGCCTVLDETAMEAFNREGDRYTEEGVDRQASPRDLAYVIYTSGSTGQPKGVEVEHRSLLNLSYWHNGQFGVGRQDHATLYAGVGFDASAWELFPYLIKGACLYVVPEAVRLSAEELLSFYEENGITISFLPTQIGEQVINYPCRTLRYLLLGGDKLSRFVKREYSIVNNYGPTENTVVATSQEIREWEERIPIGRPIGNTEVYIVDKGCRLCPVGIAGEICIGGESLARGYRNSPELTAQKFVPSLFRAGERLYRTGDVGRWRSDGSIEFMGRKDDQVKIRGYRVELGEVESVLKGCVGEDREWCW